MHLIEKLINHWISLVSGILGGLIVISYRGQESIPHIVIKFFAIAILLALVLIG